MYGMTMYSHSEPAGLGQLGCYAHRLMPELNALELLGPGDELNRRRLACLVHCPLAQWAHCHATHATMECAYTGRIRAIDSYPSSDAYVHGFLKT